MRHRKKTIKLGRSPAHRDAVLASLVCSLIETGRIQTTLPKAKAARSLAERMVTLGKRGSLADRRRAVAKLRRAPMVSKLFSGVAPAFADRAGGYTRITKLGARASDGAERAVLEWTESIAAPVEKKTASAEN